MTESDPSESPIAVSRYSERWVGLFVIGAAVLLIAGLAAFIWYTASQRGWFLNKAPYFTYVNSAKGLKEGDKVKLMGFDVGEITEIEAMPADYYDWNVSIKFDVWAPYYGYLWMDSRVRVESGDLLGGRYLEVTRGFNGQPSYKEEGGRLVAQFDGSEYIPFTPGMNPFQLHADESAVITDQVNALIGQVQAALPGFLALTNQVAGVLTQSTLLSSNLNQMTVSTKPTLDNLALISANLTNANGGLGAWAIPTNINQEIETTLVSAGNTLQSADQNMTLAVSNLSLTLTTVANLTSNLNSQVAVNTNILGEISTLVTTANDFMEKLRDHWLLRSAFREKRRR